MPPRVPASRLQAMIVLDDLSKSFGTREVLKGVSLEIPDGQNTVVIGPRAREEAPEAHRRMLEPDRGTVRVDDATVHELNREELAALRGRRVVFQFAALFDSMTVSGEYPIGPGPAGLRQGRDRGGRESRRAWRWWSEGGSEQKYQPSCPGACASGSGSRERSRSSPRYIFMTTTNYRPGSYHRRSDGQLIMRTAIRRHRARGYPRHEQRFHLGDRIAMLHDGAIRQVGKGPDPASADPVVRQFIEGRAQSDGGGAGLRRSAG